VALRSIVSSLLPLAVLATSLWGGCVSCEQYFMFPGHRQSCCNESGRCERPGKNSQQPEKSEKVDCNRLPLQQTASAHIPAPAVLPMSFARPIEQVLVYLANSSAFDAPLEASPPDAQALRATFLI
jgi:hypothetical protein